jgi:dihydrofolate reductase
MNIVISSNKDLTDKATVCQSLDDALETAKKANDIESVYVIGGKRLYEESFKHPNCGKIIVSHILGDYECDVKLDDLPTGEFFMFNTWKISSKVKVLEFIRASGDRKRKFGGIKAQFD